MSDVLLFDHIPKTAGSTLRHILFRVYGGRSVLLTTETGRHQERLDLLQRLLHDAETDVRAIVSHTGVGLHEALPPIHRYRRFTVLRDPVQRTLSSYYYGVQRGGRSSGLPLAEWLEQVPLHAQNVQTAFLAGLHEGWHLRGEPVTEERLTPELLDTAKRNLLAYEVVGLTERFEETLLLLRQAFSWPLWRTLHRRVNVGRARPPEERLAPQDLEAVRAKNRFDVELYEWAKGLFEEQRRERLGRRLPMRLGAFRTANAVYDSAYPLVHPPARAAVHGWRHLRGAPSGGS